jgi:hypothetical protein
VRGVLVRLLLGLVRGYQLFLRPLLPPACRYQPSCSVYATEALQRHGPVQGSWLAVRRICRCHPFHAGGYDPVPLPVPLPPSTAGNGEPRP